jgi:hypothetical protein
MKRLARQYSARGRKNLPPLRFEQCCVLDLALQTFSHSLFL